MRYRIIKIVALLTLLVQLSSCVTHRVKTDRRRAPYARYHRAGKYW